MRDFEDFINGLNQEIKIPENVNRVIDETLSNLDSGEKKTSHRWIRTTAVAAAILLVCSVVLVSNPSMASQITFMGNIFKMLGNKVYYSGDYKDSKVLKEDESGQKVLTDTNKGIRITASEVYSDGFSVYVTMRVDSAKYDFSKLEKNSEGRQSINLAISYGINCAAPRYDYDIVLWGKGVNDHTFIGIAKFDRTNDSLETGYVNMKIRKAYIETPDKDNLDGYVVSGNWELVIPFEVSGKDVKEIAVNEHIKSSLVIEKLYVSPYQLIVFAECPYEYCEVMVFDQDGKPLLYDKTVNLKDGMINEVFSLGGRDISSVHIYVSKKDIGAFELIGAKTEKEAAKLSEYDFTVDLK